MSVLLYQQIVSVYQDISPNLLKLFLQMEPGVDRKREHGEGSPTYKLGCSARIVGLKASWCAFWPWGSREDAESAALTFQPAFSVHFMRYSWYTPNIWLGTSAKNAVPISKAKQKKKQTKTQLQRSPSVQVPHFPTPFPPQPDWSTLADSCWSSTPHTSKVKSKSSKPKIAYPKWEREVFPKDMNITILWDLDISNEQVQRKHWTKKRKHPNVHIPEKVRFPKK